MPGMLSSAPQAEMQGQPAQEGMLSGAQSGHKGYNGMVDVEGKPVQVSNGVADLGGQRYFVTEDGALVLDAKLQPIGYVEDGQFHASDAHHRQILKQYGYIQ